MSVNEILSELETLSADDLQVIRQKLDLLRDDTTPEMHAAIEEGLRSSREEPHCSIEDLEGDMRSWTSGSK